MQDVFEPMNNFDSEVFEPMNNFDGDYSNFYPVAKKVDFNKNNIDLEIKKCDTTQCVEKYAYIMYKTNKVLANLYLNDLKNSRKIKENALKDVIKDFSSNEIKNLHIDNQNYKPWILRDSIIAYFRKNKKPYILDVSKYTIFKDVNKNYHPFNDLLPLTKDTENINYKTVKKTPELVFAGLNPIYINEKKYSSNNLSFDGEVFEPLNSFDGEVFEPMNNFVGKHQKHPKSKPVVEPKKVVKKVVEKTTEEVTTPVVENKPIEDVNTQSANNNSDNEKIEKFLGMPKKVGIGVTIGIVAIAGFFIYKKFGTKILKKITKK